MWHTARLTLKYISDEIANRDPNRVPVLLLEKDDGSGDVMMARCDANGRLKATATVSAGAPSNATYVTLSTNATLSAERVLTGTANQVVITDNGAGSTVVLSLPQSIATTSTPTFASLTLTAASSLTLGTASSNTGAIILKNSTNANTTTIQAGAAGANIVFTLPTTDGGASEVLSTDGNGVLSWVAAGAGTVTTVSVVTANGVSGSVANATSTPAITLTLGAITPTTVNGLTITSSTGTLTITNSKTVSVTNTLTLSGTDGTTMTFPSTSASIARTDAANTFTGASTASAWVLTAPTITTSIVPTSDDGAALGDATHNFSDLFLASGALIKFASTNVVITHTSGILTMGTGEFRITTPGTDATSVPTLGSTSILTNKTLTSPTINASTLTGNQNIAALPGSDHSANGPTTSIFNLGATIAIMDLVYLGSSSKWLLTDADAAATASGMLGICLDGGVDTDTTTVALAGSFVRDDTWNWTPGAPLYIDTATAGQITATQPSGTDDVVRVVGFATTADTIYFCPSPDYITHT